MRERWKTLPDDQYYQVSNLGRVRSLDQPVYNSDGSVHHYRKGKIRKHKDNGRGYKCIQLRGGLPQRYIHRMVLQTFKPVDGMENLDVNHIDGDKSNNTLSNLEWCTKSENMKHAYNTGLRYRGDRCTYSRIKFDEIQEMRRLRYDEGVSVTEIANMYGISHQYASRLTRGIQRREE